MALGKTNGTGLNLNGQVDAGVAQAEQRVATVKTELLKKLSDDGQNVVFDVSFKNTSKQPITLDPESIRGNDTQGRVYWAGLVDDTLLKTLSPGQTVHSAVGFTLARGAQVNQVYVITR